MSEEAKEKFLKIQELFRRMDHEVVCVVVESYYIWRILTFARSIPEVGQEQADKNAQLMYIYKDFFIPTEQSHLQTFIIGLMKFFDKKTETLSIAGLIKEIEKNKSVFTTDVLRDVHPNLAKIGAIQDDYVPINQETIDYIKQLRNKHMGLIDNLKNIRDKQFAHTDMKTIKGTFIPLKIEDLIGTMQEIYNKLFGIFDLTSTTWDNLKDDAIRNTKFLLESLERSEIYRQEELRKKYGY